MDYSSYFWQGRHVRLRPVRLEDADEAWLRRLDSPGRQALQLGVELPVTVEGLRKSLERYVDCAEVDGTILFTIEDPDGRDVGGLAWHSRDLKNGTFSFGITIPAPHRRRGYAADAVRILLRYAFRERRYHKCNSACIATNEASDQLHRSLGFKLEGRRREVWFYDGRYHDELLFGLTRDEFEALEAGDGQR